MIVGGRGAVGDTHDDGAAAAVLEELLDRVGNGRGLPQAAEHVLEFGEARDRDRPVHRPLEGAADEGGDCGWQARDDRLGPGSRELQAGRTAFNHC